MTVQIPDRIDDRGRHVSSADQVVDLIGIRQCGVEIQCCHIPDQFADPANFSHRYFKRGGS